MNENATGAADRRRRLGMGVGMLAAGAIVGGVLSGAWSASAADDTSGTTSGGSSSYAVPAQQGGPGGQGGMRGGGGPGGGGGQRSDETVVTGADADTLKAAALAAVPGSTVNKVETDAGDGAYEAHMTKSDGSLVTVKFDQDFTVIGVEDGMGKGDPAPSGGNGGNGGPGGGAPGQSAAQE